MQNSITLTKTILRLSRTSPYTPVKVLLYTNIWGILIASAQGLNTETGFKLQKGVLSETLFH